MPSKPSGPPPVPFPAPDPGEPCVVIVPVPAGTVDLLDSSVIAEEIAHGEEENAESL